MPRSTPLRWPDSWTDPSTLTLLDGTPFDFLFVSDSPSLDAVRRRAQTLGLACAHPGRAPASTLLVQGEWPGLRIEHRGAAGSGPTGVPWVDSNAWRIRLARAQNPFSAVWVDAAPRPDALLTPGTYQAAFADAASRGGRWIVSLDPAHASALALRSPSAMACWTALTRAASYFASHSAWDSFHPAALAGVLSNFSGPNAFLSGELLNLLDRAGLQVRIIPRDSASPASFDGLHALISLDAAPLPRHLAASLTDFVRSGATLVTIPNASAPSADAPRPSPFPRFSLRSLGRGTVATWTNPDPDPYLLANDTANLVSHRYDLVRFWNAGAAGYFYSWAPDRSHALVQLLFYSTRPPSSASLRVAGRFRRASASSPDQPVSTPVSAAFSRDAVEISLSDVPHYLALELAV